MTAIGKIVLINKPQKAFTLSEAYFLIVYQHYLSFNRSGRNRFVRSIA